MPNFKEIKKKLEDFGLSEKQALIYLFLVQHRELRIQEIVKLAQIPRTSVYENLKVLQDFGLVEKIIDDKFTRIKPYPLNAIKHGLHEKLLQVQTQIDNVDNLEKVIDLLPKAQSQPPAIVRYYKNISGARQLLWNTLNAKETVYVYSAWGRGRYVGIKFYKSFVQESREKAIKEKVLVNPTKRVLESIQKYSGTSISRTTPKDIRGLDEKEIPIKGETFIYDNIYALVYLHDEEINGFEIESTQFAKTQRSIFEKLWTTATPLSSLA